MFINYTNVSFGTYWKVFRLSLSIIYIICII
nr:MAG TPA: hypothetical protein [Caudoviricetes sp.]